MQKAAKVVPEILTDGSKVYNVHLYEAAGDKHGPVIAVLGCQTAGHARTLADLLNSACFVERPSPPPRVPA